MHLEDTFEAWSCPTHRFGKGVGKVIDHAFIYCPTYDGSFKCWGDADRTVNKARRLFSAKKKNAYTIANQYRAPIRLKKHTLPDTAGIGIYAINGVCHQTANLFLYSAGSVLQQVNGHPKGLLSSTLGYGVHGTDFVGHGLLAKHNKKRHFRLWLGGVYQPAERRAGEILSDGHLTGTMQAHSEEPALQKINSNNLLDKIIALYDRLDQENQNENATPKIGVVEETKIILSHYLPDIDENIIMDSQKDVFKEREKVISSFGIEMDDHEKIIMPNLKTDDVKSLITKINTLSLTLQSDLFGKLGTDDFEKINGDSEYYMPIDPDIAKKVFESMA